MTIDLCLDAYRVPVRMWRRNTWVGSDEAVLIGRAGELEIVIRYLTNQVIERIKRWRMLKIQATFEARIKYLTMVPYLTPGLEWRGSCLDWGPQPAASSWLTYSRLANQPERFNSTFRCDAIAQV